MGTQNAIVTGASRGIGECIARALAARGTNLLLVAHSEPDLVRLAKELRAQNVKVAIAVVRLNVSVDEAQRRLDASGGRLRIVLNEA